MGRESNYGIVRAQLFIGPMALQNNPYGKPRFANSSNSNPGGGGTPRGAFETLQEAVNAANAWDTIFVAAGAYDETTTIPRTKQGLTLIGAGGRGAAFIEPSTEDAEGLIVHADDVTIYNLGAAGEDETSAAALRVTGSRFRAYGCKLEGGLSQLVIGPGTVAQEAAGTHGVGADALFDDCEFAWGTNGVVLTASDYGAVTQPRFHRCLFHNLTAAAFEEAGGSADIRYRDLELIDCIFRKLEDGTNPTKFISLNDDNANTGIVSGCRFPVAINSGLNLVSTALIWAANYHTGGISTGQPS